MSVKQFCILGLVFAFAGVRTTNAQMRITEWMYSGNSGEYIEFTNVGVSPIDMSGWSFDDDSRTPGVVDLSAYGTVLAGESVLLTEIDASTLRSNWGLSAAVKIIGLNAANLARNDEINIYSGPNAADLVDRLTYGDQNIPGTIRTQNISGIPSSAAALGANNPALWQYAAVGDVYGSRVAPIGGDVGNPGVYAVPEPISLLLVAAAVAVGLVCRHR